MKRIFTGLNIQFPISALIMSGEKTVETRTYKLPTKYLGEPLLLIETPGIMGHFASRIVATITFNECILYKSEEDFNADYKRHRVNQRSEWKWTNSKPKFGWVISELKPFKKPVIYRKQKGIVFTRGITLSEPG
jgi:hypothetical protein